MIYPFGEPISVFNGIIAEQSKHMSNAPVFISSEIYRGTGYNRDHPLGIARIGTVLDLCEGLSWLEPSGYVASPRATFEELTRFHSADYVQAIIDAENAAVVAPHFRERYNLGTRENPVFKGLFERATTSVGGSIEAARHVLDGGLAYHPSGGTHHGQTARASGFCYFNDPVFAILTLLDAGLDRVVYIDLDAHHGDGVQMAFENEPRVRTISVHEEGRWPYTGKVDDRGNGGARNIPVPGAINDSEMVHVLENAILPLAHDFEPQAMVMTCGSDCLQGDPLSSMELSNLCLIEAVEKLAKVCPRTVVLGGGGYNPWTVSRCWAGIWGMLIGKTLPASLPRSCQEILNVLECDLVDEEDVEQHWTQSLVDPPNPGPVRDEIKSLVDAVMID